MFDFSQLNSILGGFSGTPTNAMSSPFANVQGFQGLLQPYVPYGQTESPYTQMNPFTGQMIQDYLSPFMAQREEWQNNPNQATGPTGPGPVPPQPAPADPMQYYLGTTMFGDPNWGTARDRVNYGPGGSMFGGNEGSK